VYTDAVDVIHHWSRVSRFCLYLTLAWGTLVALWWGAIPSAPWLVSLVIIAAALYVSLPLFAFMAGGVGWRRYPTAGFRLWVVRPALYGQLLLPFVSVAAVVGLLVGAVAGHPRTGGQFATAAVLAICLAILFVGWVGSRSLVVREVDAFVPELPDAFDGFRIAQVSDLHLGPQTSRRFLDSVTKAVRGLAPDVVTVTGDLIDDRAEDATLFAGWLETLGAPPHGTYLIPGNHDVYAGWSDVHARLRSHSVAHVLVNDSQLLTRGGAVIALVGLGDPAGRGPGPQLGVAAPDVPRAFAAVPRGIAVVAFAHNPALWPSIAKRGAALTLSGHTHWGQFALPRLGWSLASPFLQHAMGAYQEGEALLYVHPGTGFWGIPFRLGALPEIALVTLRKADSAAIAMGKARAA
jgi:predicted MPP superfamily phosphohydrolase